MLAISPIPAFQDNYFWLITEQSNCVVVDPGDATPVLEALEQNNYTLSGILCTHHHADHTGGIAELQRRFDVPVYGPSKEAKQFVTDSVLEGDIVNIGALQTSFLVLEVPGHTLGHIAFYNEENQSLFCGDTLFAAGCGRLFEGSPSQMYNSLQKLFALPDETKVYCAHEYTLANLQFAQAAEPENQDVINRITEVKEIRAKEQPSLPSTIGLEKRTNPFLRCDKDSITANIKLTDPLAKDDPISVFTYLRAWKDQF